MANGGTAVKTLGCSTHSLKRKPNLDLLRMVGNVKKHIPNGGLVVIYEGKKWQITLNKSKIMFNMEILWTLIPTQDHPPTPHPNNNHLGDGLETVWKMFKLEIWYQISGWTFKTSWNYHLVFQTEGLGLFGIMIMVYCFNKISCSNSFLSSLHLICSCAPHKHTSNLTWRQSCVVHLPAFKSCKFRATSGGGVLARHIHGQRWWRGSWRWGRGQHWGRRPWLSTPR